MSIFEKCVFYEHDEYKIPLHFGFITKEAEDFAKGRGIVDLSFHKVYKITGKDRYTWLSKLTSQTFIENEDTYSKEALILNPQGYVIFALNVFVDKNFIYVIEQKDLPLDEISFSDTDKNFESTTQLCESDVKEENENPLQDFFSDSDLKNFLQKMVFMADVDIEDISTRCEIVAVANEVNMAGIFGKVCDLADYAAVWQDPWPCMGAKNATYYNLEYTKALFENISLDMYTSVENTIVDTSHPANGNKLALCIFEKAKKLDEKTKVEKAEAKEEDREKNLVFSQENTIFEHLAENYSPCGILAFESWKIVNYRPWGYVNQNKVLPHEVDWLRTAVQLNKGCYCGQETVARIVNVGKPPRRLVKLYIDGYMEEIPVKNDPICIENLEEKQQIGKVLNVANHYDEGYIALGLIKRNADTNNAVLVGNLAANCEEIVSCEGRCTASPNTDNIMNIRKRRLK